MRTDLHVHSFVSMDSEEPMSNSIQAAIQAGLSAICFTDHCDIVDGVDPSKMVGVESYSNWKRGYARIEQARADWGDQIEILHGMELSEIPQDPILSREIAKAPKLDFLLGAVHAVPDMPDFYSLDYPDDSFCRSLMDTYLDENIRLAEGNLTDVVAHLGFPNRYMMQQGFRVDLMDFEEKLRRLFELLVKNGRGLELNTSGLRQGGETFPDPNVLKLYQACGGEIVTVGSDAHRATDVGKHLDEAYALLKTVGFPYMTIFQQRKPTFIKIPD